MELQLLWLNILVPSLTMAMSLFATLYTVGQRVKNENREKHKPYIILKDVEPLSELDIYSYYLTLLSTNYSNDEVNEEICLNIQLENIGYGVASNIKFYNLITGKPLVGNQKRAPELNQKLYTTSDIGTSKAKTIQFKIIHSVLNDKEVEEDHNRILCTYQDLNENTYDIIISINVKPNGHYDFFAYQRTSKSYKKWIKESSREYKNILKDYKNL